jgi:hypothetical protein
MAKHQPNDQKLFEQEIADRGLKHEPLKVVDDPFETDPFRGLKEESTQARKIVPLRSCSHVNRAFKDESERKEHQRMWTYHDCYLRSKYNVGDNETGEGLHCWTCVHRVDAIDEWVVPVNTLVSVPRFLIETINELCKQRIRQMEPVTDQERVSAVNAGVATMYGSNLVTKGFNRIYWFDAA